MKQAYVSVVIPWTPTFTRSTLQEVDAALGRRTRGHELVLVVPAEHSGHPALDALREPGAFTSPLSLVVIWHDTDKDVALVAGLARAAGDFVLEWHAAPAELTDAVLDQMLGATDEGFEVVELTPIHHPWLSRAFYRVANGFRPRSTPLRPSLATLYSRRALNTALAANRALPNRHLMVADMGLPRFAVVRDVPRDGRGDYRHRWGEAFGVLTRGTRAASILPGVAAFVFAALSLGGAVFAVVHFFTTGRAPEGWTTLMVVVGLGLAAVLGFLGLLWERVDNLARMQSHTQDPTSTVIVVPPVPVPAPPSTDPVRTP